MAAARCKLAQVGASACAIVILDHATGGVRAMVLPSLPQHREVNLPLPPRSAGSTLMPFLNLDARDPRIATAASLLPNTEEAVREVYADYDPRSYNDRFVSPARLREALGNSLNVPAVVVLSRIGGRVAVKTGMSSGFRDGWCVGFTAGHTVGVWAGNPDESPMDSALAMRSAAPVWNALVRHLLAHGDFPVRQIEASESLSPVLVAAETGLLPRPGEPTDLEWFLTGTAPTESAASMYRPLGGKQILQLPGSRA